MYRLSFHACVLFSAYRSLESRTTKISENDAPSHRTPQRLVSVIDNDDGHGGRYLSKMYTIKSRIKNTNALARHFCVFHIGCVPHKKLKYVATLSGPAPKPTRNETTMMKIPELEDKIENAT